MAKRKLMKLIVTAARIVITIVIFIFWILVILIVPNLLKDYGIKIVVLNLFAFLFFFMYLNTYLHELGHVMAGKLMKIGIQKVMIGDGRELIRTNLFGFPLIITNSIKGGFTFPSHIKGRLLRLRVSIFTAGGILAQALFIFICILVRRLEPGAFYLSKG